MARSAPFVAGNKLKASDLNNLRDDVLSGTYGHTHTGGSDGKQIPDLVDHLAATNGIHGNIAGDYVAGIRPDGRIEYGSVQLTFEASFPNNDWKVFPSTSSYFTFGSAFANAPIVFLTQFPSYTQNPYNPDHQVPGYRVDMYPTDVAAEGFRIIASPVGDYGSQQTVTVYWVAIGL